MVTKLVLLAVALSTALAVIPIVAVARPDGVALNASIQEDSSDESQIEESVARPPVGPLAPGRRFVGTDYVLEIQGADISESVNRHAYTEVRVAVAYRDDSGAVLPYTHTALSGEGNYPRIELVDDEGVVYQVDRSNANMAIAGSSVASTPAFLPAHWTLGFQVPTSQASELTARVVRDGDIGATWDLTLEAVALTGWDAPADMQVVTTGESFEWSTGLNTTFVRTYGDACGDPYSVISAGAGMAFVEVESTGVTDALFPNIEYPAPSFVAVWNDGSTARIDRIDSADPFFVTADELGLQRTDNVLVYEDFAIVDYVTIEDAISEEKIIMAPGTNETFALSFPVPRDSRLVDPQANPVAVYAVNPDGSEFWIDLSDAPDFDAPFFFENLVDDYDGLSQSEKDFFEDATQVLACALAVPTRYLDTIDGNMTFVVETGIPSSSEIEEGSGF